VGSFSTIGNTDLQPQKTATYEIGLQQAIGQTWRYPHGYYKDIRTCWGMEATPFYPALTSTHEC
jgi:hypothetical protein